MRCAALVARADECAAAPDVFGGNTSGDGTSLVINVVMRIREDERDDYTEE